MNVYKIERLRKADNEIAKQISGLVEQLAPGSPRIGVEKIRETVNNPTTQVLTARDETGRIVGMATLLIIHKLQGEMKAIIEDVVVDETARGKGLGKMLIEKVLEEARKQRVKKVFLTSRPTRKTANLMYQKMGFEKYETNNYIYDTDLRREYF